MKIKQNTTAVLLTYFISFSVFICPVRAESTRQPDLATLKARFQQLLAPAGLDTSNLAVKALIRDIDKQAEAALSSQNMDRQSDGYGSWGKLKKRDGDTVKWFSAKIYRMTRAWACPNSKHHKSGKVLTQITAACEYLYPFIKPGGEKPGNWWGWEIGVPRSLSNTLILLEDSLPGETREKMLEALTGADGKKGLVDIFYRPYYKSGGANAMDVAFNQMRVACITGNEKYAANGAKLVSILSSRDGSYKTDLGIQDDYSYHFHGHGINMGYGREQIKRMSSFLQLTSGTKFSLSDNAFELFQKWFREFIIFNTYKGHISPFTAGRSISRDGAVVDPVELEMAMTLYLADGATCKDLALSFIGEWYDARPKEEFYTLSIATLAPQVEPHLNRAQPMPTGARFYPTSDYMAGRMGRFYTAVLMSSKRTKAWHSIRDENIRGHSSGDGTLVIMTGGHEFDNNIIPTMNWYEPSGVTVAHKVRVRPEREGHSTVVGGLAHQEVSAMAGMDFLIDNGSKKLKARKSYTVTPLGIALAGTRIRCPGLEHDKPFFTTLHQCPLREDDSSLIIDGKRIPLKDGAQTVTVQKWLHVRNYGYIFPEPTEIEIQIKTSEKAYTYINKRYGTDTKYKARFYSLRVNHDLKQENNTYAAIIVPEVSPGAMQKASDDFPLEIKAKSETAHIIDDKHSRTRYLYFFQKENLEGYSASQPLFLALSRENTKLYVTVQDPAHKGGSVSFGVPFSVSSSKKEVQIKASDNGSGITVNLDKGWPKELVLNVR